MSLRPGDRTELKPGMTFHFMTGALARDDGAWRSPRAILITETGVECLANCAAQAVRQGLRP